MENNRPVDELDNVVHYGKKRKSPIMTLDFSLPTCLQKLTPSYEWRKGDPNSSTTPHYDFVWLLWVLRQVFPKDIVTHMMNLVGGMTFYCQRQSVNSLIADGLHWSCEERIELDYFTYRTITNNMRPRRLYLNISIDQMVFEKGKIYLWYKDGITMVHFKNNEFVREALSFG